MDTPDFAGAQSGNGFATTSKPAKVSTMLQKLLDRWTRPSARGDSETSARKKMFADIHAGKLWGVDCESVSGPGSGVARVSLFRADFERLLQELSIGVMLDAGCGDFNWLPTFDLRGTRVVGVDIVPELISGNRLRHPASDLNWPISWLIRCRKPTWFFVVTAWFTFPTRTS